MGYLVRPKKYQEIHNIIIGYKHPFMHATKQLHSSFRGVVGLDYTAVQVTANAMNIDLNMEVLTGIRACVADMLDMVNKG